MAALLSCNFVLLLLADLSSENPHRRLMQKNCNVHDLLDQVAIVLGATTQSWPSASSSLNIFMVLAAGLSGVTNLR
jgi:hypothetical protein